MNGDPLQPIALADAAGTVLDRLATVVRTRPQARAARVGASDLTWADLDQRANGLASVLHEQSGPGPEPVAIIGGWGPEAVIAPLAVLKSGRPYTAIDSSLPLPRVMQILDLCGATSAVIGEVDSQLRGALDGAKLSLVAADQPSAPLGPTVTLGPADPANVVFTSGSTGVPKGVVVSHRYYVFHAATCAQRGFGTDDRVGLVIPLSFAYGAIVFWRTMLMGATILPYDPRREGIGALVAWCASEGVEVLEATPSLLRAIARGTEDQLSTLRIVESAGEPLFAVDAAHIVQRLAPTCVFRNGIGSSETGAYAYFEWPRHAETLEGIVPVGRGGPLKEITVCDDEGTPVTGGETGTITVTSEYFANGYWGQPDLTTQRFVPTPDGRVRYNTGDLGRWLPDGSLLHLGRRDGMVKIHGYLVEPSEVEAALLDTGLVFEAAAFGVTDDSGRAALHAYVVPIDGIRSSNAAIRRALRKRVPEYFVPTHMSAVPALAKNDNNKIDRAALTPIPAEQTLANPPRTEWERAVADIWCAVLALDDIDLDGDFFALGGDSLGVLELIAALADTLGVTVHSADLVECPTLGTFAARARKPDTPRGGVLVPLRNGSADAPLFCFAGGGGLAGDFLLLARHLDTERPVYGLQARGIEGGGLPDWSAKRWVARCIAQIRRVQPRGPYFVGGHSFGGMLALEAVRQFGRAGDDVGLLVLVDTLAQNSTGFGSAMFGTPDGQAMPKGSDPMVRRLAHQARRAAEVFVKANLAGLHPKHGEEKFELFYRHAEILYRLYRPAPVECPTVLYWAESIKDGDMPYDFAPLLRGPWEARTQSGNHLTIMGEPNVESLAAHLSPLLANPSLVGRQLITTSERT